MAEVSNPTTSDFRKYMESNPDVSEQMMKILTTLYNNPMKEKEV
jgi:hypothetical protein